jgi:hypothetical protein
VPVQRSDNNILRYDATKISGVYRLRSPEGKVTWFVVPRDPREGDLTPLNDEDRAKLAKLIGLTFDREEAGDAEAAEEEVQRQELWLYVLLGMIILLCVEVWMTRRLVMNR